MTEPRRTHQPTVLKWGGLDSPKNKISGKQCMSTRLPPRNWRSAVQR